VNTVLGYPLVTGLTFSTSAPAPGTLTSSPPTLVVEPITLADPVFTVSHAVRLSLSELGTRGPFPGHAMRHEVAVEVDAAFSSGRTITVGDAEAEDALLGATPVALDATGRSVADSTCTQYRTQYEAALAPTATIELGSTLTATTGLVYVQITYSPHPSTTASAA